MYKVYNISDWSILASFESLDDAARFQSWWESEDSNRLACIQGGGINEETDWDYMIL